MTTASVLKRYRIAFASTESEEDVTVQFSRGAITSASDSGILPLCWDDVESSGVDEVMASFDEVLASVEDDSVTGKYSPRNFDFRSMPGYG